MMMKKLDSLAIWSQNFFAPKLFPKLKIAGLLSISMRIPHAA